MTDGADRGGRDDRSEDDQPHPEDDDRSHPDDDQSTRTDDDGALDPSITGPGEDPTDAASPDVDVASDAPLGDLAERARRSQERDSVDDGAMDVFEEVEVDDVDADRLWAELEDDDLTGVVDEPQSSAERDVRVVSKRDYCMRCQYFSAPPEISCGHENGEILEMVDTEQFEVADCPILRGEENLENLRR